MIDTIAQYKLLERLGAGGIGEVFRARDTRLGRTVAITLVSSEIAGDPERRARFMTDAAAASTVSHPSVAALYEVSDDHGQLFLATEFVPGTPLTRLIAGRGLNLRRAIECAIQIADALAEAHAAGLTHRALTTSNIVVTPKGTVKVMELGFASWTRGGRSSDARDDIYALGRVVFEMTAGQSYVDAGAAPAQPSALNRDVPREIDPIVARMLARDPGSAYGSPATVAAELREVLETLADRARPVERPPTPSSRRRSAARGWLLVAAALLLLATGAWFALR
jgi:serine/threonine protein kinase